jgi:hypothetical protein
VAVGPWLVAPGIRELPAGRDEALTRFVFAQAAALHQARKLEGGKVHLFLLLTAWGQGEFL